MYEKAVKQKKAHKWYAWKLGIETTLIEYDSTKYLAEKYFSIKIIKDVMLQLRNSYLRGYCY